MLDKLCPPALIYLLFSITHVVMDTANGLYNSAMVKMMVAFIFTILLNQLCVSGLSVVSWLFVFMPFILMSLIVALLLLAFGLDPRSGRVNVVEKSHFKHVKGHPIPETYHRDSRGNIVEK